jgi:hypothetical protein
MENKLFNFKFLLLDHLLDNFQGRLLDRKERGKKN